MPLQPGARLGPYEVVSLVGAGGMGEVYRGRDTRLNRTVAIKVRTSAETDGLRERFERESRAVSSLNHPHICALYDVGREGDIDFFVMEFVEGETLAARLTRGALPVDQAIRVAVEVADALACAHAAGIVHRDLKPANIMLTKAGVKLLDFGIAKLSALPGDAGMSTRTRPAVLTQEGAWLGTLQYMAPEQLERRDVDERTDIFAFGLVLFEMIAGRPPFEGQSGAATIAAILNASPPPLTTLQPLTPPSLERLVNACLVKSPDERWQSSRDLRRELGWLSAPTEVPGAGMARLGAPSLRRRLIVAAGCLVVGGLLGAAWTRARSPAPLPPPRARFAIVPGPAEALLSAFRDNQSAGPGLDISPDGSKLVYVVVPEVGSPRLVLHSLDRVDPTPLPGTDNGATPFFSPDGLWVGFIADGKLKKVSIDGTAPLTLCSVPPVTRGASWGPDGTIYISPTFSGGLFKVSAGGGALEPVTSLQSGESNHLLPHVLPGARGIVFTVWKGGSFDDASVWLWLTGTGERRKLIDSASGARYSATGHLIFARSGAMLAVPFDLARLQVGGAPSPVVDAVLMNPANGTAEFAVSADGTLVYGTAPAQPAESTLVWVDRAGKEERVADIPAQLQRPRLSPDGQRVALEHLNDIWVYELASGAFRRITSTGVNQYAVWTRDGKHLVFSRAPTGSEPALFSTPSDGSGATDQITAGDFVDFPNDWSPDGAVLAFARNRGINDRQWDILAHRNAGGPPTAIVDGAFNQSSPVFAPDGQWLAYVSTQSGRPEVYVQAYPVSGPRAQISSDGGSQPRWSRDGKEIFYLNGQKFMRAGLTTAPELGATRSTTLFEGRYQYDVGEPGYPGFDVSPDGQRFLMIKTKTGAAAPVRLTVVLDGLAEQRRAGSRP